MGNLKKHKLNSQVLKIKVNKLEIKSRIKDKQNTGHKESIDIRSGPSCRNPDSVRLCVRIFALVFMVALVLV